MKKWKRIITIIALSTSVIVGSTVGVIYNDSKNTHSDNSESVIPITLSLEEELWNVDLVVKGTVVSQEDSYSKDAGVPSKRSFNIDITPSTIKVDKVLYGSTDSSTITYLQHGLSTDKEASKRFVKQGEEVVLILSKTEDGKYWSYNFGDGQWTIKDGKVISDATSNRLLKYKNYPSDMFVNEIAEIAKNKRKNKEYQQ
ncbi:hypothetical protein [Paenibacillus oryzisoli]|uniref:Uncharacterized protein n=1 Tax=Paenibacillus oryzisoli TaxID=1850517 RepID=A0A198ABC6_9BACL|nr:hypothetical protein [Paenibacillus oryzisoli]OAS18366.1 hypothetical protein A8708_00060 [Paenibacillus oryzisoli]